MPDVQRESSFITNYLSDYIFTYFDIDNNTALLILRFDEPSNVDSNLSNLTSSIFSKFLNTTRTGSAHKHSGISVQTFLSTILVSTAYFGCQVLLFSSLRLKFTNVYQARSRSDTMGTRHLAESRKQEGQRNRRMLWKFFKTGFGWIYPVLVRPTEDYYERVGLDAYFFLRFVRVLSILFLLLSIIHIPILIPIHYFSNHFENVNEVSGTLRWLDRINISTVVRSKSKKLIFHLILSLSVVAWYHLMLISELKHVRAISVGSKKAKTQTLIYLENIPEGLRGDKSKIVEYFNLLFPETAIEARFLPKHCKELKKQYNVLKKIQRKMEIVAVQIVLDKFFTKLSKKVTQNNGTELSWKTKIHVTIRATFFHLKTCQRYFKFKTKLKWKSQKCVGNRLLPFVKIQLDSFTRERYECFGMTAKQYRMKSKIWRTKCTTIKKWSNLDYFFAHKNPKTQVYYDKAFIRFKSANIAQAVGQLLLYSNTHHFDNVLIVPDVSDIIWRNMVISNSVIKFLRAALANILSVFIIVGYIIPVAFVALMSQIPYFTSLVPLLSKMTTESKLLNDVMAGIIPVITLVWLTEFAPYIFRCFSYLRCKRTGAEIEIDTQRWFFAFLFVHVFLVVTISSGVSFLIERIVNNPVTIPTLLAHDLPKSSNFFCSFIVMRCLAYAGGNFLQLKELLFEIFYYRLTTYSPRTRIYRMKYIPSFQWGSIYPIFSVLGSIGIIYSIISPIILPLCCIGFYLVFFSFKYICEFQYNGSNISETYGRLYPHALMQLYSGIYFMEFCMIGLFALSSSLMLCSCMVIGLLMTIVAHYKFSESYLKKLHKFSILDYWKDLLSESEYHNDCEISIPFADGKLDTVINLPQDNEEIAKKEHSYIEQNYGVECCLDKFSLTDSGEMTCNYL
ncbi:hypothetical protein HG535_0A05320 [Zygotorulaspora mrakii]|uniref:CSC1/OSCA1-like 7TM region domain-containing protein n=1 Tax=Zygotorulaspora mrakii TaxID=42260 RepID=A0A7H9AWE9_ZYGMR|nr:uncharacterized protein HG535_0A05320 [Zygotorulaspora mrakii]QLG70591.1 hypothetical protein HG535_0A05320 [Zygotorulaspora mrakii]